MSEKTHTCGSEFFSDKIKNQFVILQRYSKKNRESVQAQIDGMKQMKRKVENAETIDRLIGYEGQAAKLYFEALGKIVKPEFAFRKRTRRPPMDPFNSMLSLGYSIILNEIYGKIEGKGLNPYFGLLHKDRENHPTLASDLMEEWRAVLVDSTVLSMVNGNEVDLDDFYSDNEQPGIFLNNDFFRKFVKKLENKFQSDNKYLDYVDYRVSFRRALDLQVNQLVKVIETENIEEYHLSRLKFPTEMSLRRMAELHKRRQLRCCAARPRILFEIHDFNR